MRVLLTETVRIVTVLLSAWFVHTEKLYFARFLNTEDRFTYRSHVIVTETVAKCVDKCKLSDECKYINYHVASNVCYFINLYGENDVNIDTRVEKKRGYVFGKKADWTAKRDNGCLVCDGDGTCTVNRKQDTCRASGCRPPDSKLNAVALGNMFGIGNRVKYECLGNRKMTGAKQHTSTCLENGTWSATDFQCLYGKCTHRKKLLSNQCHHVITNDPDCAAPQNILNGVVTVNDNNNTIEGATATVACHPGYETEIATIKCLDTGEWQIPNCTIKDCGLKPPVNNGKVKLYQPGITTAWATATVTCIPGYAPEKSTITCLPSGIWETTVCNGPNCAAPPNILNGVVTVDDNDNTVEGATATVACHPGYETEMATIMCLDTGEWQIPTCTIKDCGLKPTVNNGKVQLNLLGITTAWATASVTCIPGYAPEKSTITCLPSGVWETTVCYGPIFTCTGESTRLAVSEACDSCLTECSDGEEEQICSCTEDQNRFITLENHFIQGNNIRSVQDVKTEADCMAQCRAEPHCKSADYVLSDLRCHLNKVMPYDVEPTKSSSAKKKNLLLRPCGICYVKK